MTTESLARSSRSLAVPANTHPRVASWREARPHCASCGVRDLCLPAGLDAGVLRELDGSSGSRSG